MLPFDIYVPVSILVQRVGIEFEIIVADIAGEIQTVFLIEAQNYSPLKKTVTAVVMK